MSGYPVILGGDHAEFEAEWAASGKPDHERPDWPLPSFDARDWAAAFCKIASGFGFKDSEGKPIDEGWMITWFANALMRGFDETSARECTRVREMETVLKMGLQLCESGKHGDGENCPTCHFMREIKKVLIT